jgi:hypothetical protein
MHYNDWPCAVQGYYVRESICADLWGGTPADYDGKPELAGAPYAGLIDCDVIPKPAQDDPQTPQDEAVPLIHKGWMSSLKCDECRACNNQRFGWNNDGQPADRWNELVHCPPKDAVNAVQLLEAWCADPVMEPPPDPTGGQEPSSGVWICNGSPEICGLMTDIKEPVTKDKICLSGNIPMCVPAADVSSAKTACHMYCKEKNQDYQNEADQSATKNWNPSFPCDNFLTSLVPAEAENPATMCAGGGPIQGALPPPKEKQP